MVDELRLSGPAIIAEGEPATDVEMMTAVLRFMAGYGIGNKDALEHKTALDLWMNGLEGLPLAAIEKGMVEASRVCTFLPKVADVYQAALPMARELQSQRYRAKRALEDVNKLSAPTAKRMTRAEMVEAGFMDAEGKIIMAPARPIQAGRTAVASPQELAERLRRHADQQDQRR